MNRERMQCTQKERAARRFCGYNQDMTPTVYIETTIPSYYFDERSALANEIARTREWWDAERGSYECYVSAVVLEELSTGDYPYKTECLNLVTNLPVLALTSEVRDIADVYLRRGLMPKQPIADALHLALASHYKLDYLLTWNCRHLANANKIRPLENMNQGMGLPAPILATPQMLYPLEKRDDR